ncbi:MAG: hypothetical protein AB2L24_21900 [Mangrovibacterium sp.]
MFEIYVNNEKIDLPTDIEVNLTWENPFLLQDRIPLTYSLSFDLPPTKKNQALFKNPTRINAVGQWSKMDAYLKFKGIIFAVGSITLNEIETKLSVSFIGSFISDLVKNKLNDLTSIDDFFYSFGAGSRFNPNFNSGWALAYKNAIFNNAIDLGNKFAACPVRVKDEEWAYDPTAYGNYNADKLYFNMFNVNDGDYLFKDGASVIHGAIFPQPYIHYLFDQVFQGKLVNNFFRSDSELRTLAMITSFHKLYSDSLMSTYRGVLVDNTYYTSDIDNYMHLNSFFNKFAFNEFLKDVLRIFCCSLLPRPDGKLDIIHNKAILDSDQIIDWSSKLVSKPLIRRQKAQIYRYGYSSESLGNKEERYPTVNNIDTLMSLSTGEGIYQIINTGEVYEKTLKDEVYEYERKETALGGNVTEKDEDTESYSITSSVRPVPMRIAEYWWLNSEVVRYPWYVPEFTEDRIKNDFSPFIGFVRGFYDIASKHTVSEAVSLAGKYPLMCPYNYDQSGNKIGNYSLAWEGVDGLIQKFHSDFKSYIERDRQILKGKFRLTELDLKNINYMEKIYIRGGLFHLKKIEGTFKSDSISLCDVELIEA